MEMYLVNDELVFNKDTAKKRAKMEGEYETYPVDLRDFTNKNLDELNEGIIKTTDEMAKDLYHKKDQEEVGVYEAHADDGMTVITITATEDGVINKYNGEINNNKKSIKVNTNIKESITELLDD